jgi:NAD(P)-dependent dehydrogenase (short-subunit alcohol dehydrogenase family)
MGRLEGKRAIVTGAAGAFGVAIVARFVAEGARVVATDLAAPPIAQGHEGKVIALAHDVCVEADWARVVKAAEDNFGGVDIVINNAGISMVHGQPQDVEDISLASWRTVNAVNVEGVLLGCQAAIRAMKGTGGTIVNLSSLAALAPSPKLAAYGATKAAVRHLTRTVAAHCAERGYGINCNSVHPGWTYTPMVRGSRTEDELDIIKQRVPLNRFAEVEEIASAILYLASDEASYLTGAKLVIDGGICGE